MTRACTYERDFGAFEEVRPVIQARHFPLKNAETSSLDGRKERRKRREKERETGERLAMLFIIAFSSLTFLAIGSGLITVHHFTHTRACE